MFFKKKPIDWELVSSSVAISLLKMLQSDVASLAKPHARFMLNKNGSVEMYFDERPAQYLFGWGNISVAFLRQNDTAFKRWVDDLKENDGSPEFQVIATEQFAKSLTRLLIQQLKS